MMYSLSLQNHRIILKAGFACEQVTANAQGFDIMPDLYGGNVINELSTEERANVGGGRVSSLRIAFSENKLPFTLCTRMERSGKKPFLFAS